ncbi:MAG TPA: class I SAM-dependent methyltransferase [Mycobacterium sp.]|nr:class I SAM-dependent methyltransferase [Mycobacterium sp.]
MAVAVSEFTALEQTAFLTVYARALDSRWARPILGDTLAEGIVGQIDYDFPAFAIPTNVICQTALRAKMLDDRVRDFTARHPEAVVVDLGAGLSTAALRVQPPAGVDWYSVDLPRVMDLRARLVPPAPGEQSVTASLGTDDWAGSIPGDRPTMLIADGLFAFMRVQLIVELFGQITDHFRAGELAFNDYGRVGRVSWAAMKAAPRGMFAVIGRVWANPGFADAHVPETWHPQLRLIEEASLTHAPEVDLFPRRARALTRLAGRTAAGARKARILRYGFGLNPGPPRSTPA